MNRRIPTIVQVGMLRSQPGSLDRCTVNTARPFDGIPINFHVGSQAQLARLPGAKHMAKIDQANLLPPCGKTQIVTRDDPAAAAIRDLQSHASGTLMMTLWILHVNRRIARMHPALSN